MRTEPGVPTAYRDLLAVPGLRPLVAGTVLSRLGGSVWTLALVLFALQRFHSPAVAGLATLLTWTPGLVVGPLAGALLDRHGRVRLIALDHGVAVAGVAALVALDRSGLLSPFALLAVVGACSVTLPLTTSGTRSLIPLLTPVHLWERVNAVDSASYNVSGVLGPALAGVLMATTGGAGTLLTIGAIWLIAGLLMLRVPEPAARSGGADPVLRSAWEGLRYVVRSPVLRRLSALVPLANVAAGVLAVALPVLVLPLPGGGDATVGALWSEVAIAALVSGLLAGRARTRGREGAIMAAALVVSGVGLVLVTAAAARPAQALALAAVGMVLVGAAEGPFDVAMFSLRQRATEPAWFGRAMSISMTVNIVGLPIGSALAGVAVGASLAGTIGAAAALTLGCAALCRALLPAPRP